MFTRRKLSLILSSLGAALCLIGCPSADVVSESKCDATRRCATDVSEVCGEDGKTYACNALARCEGVIVDPSGQACMIDGPDMSDGPDMPDEPDMCPEQCPSVCPDGYINSMDPNGCTTCACEPLDCAPVTCDLFCAEGFKTGADGCEVCECNDVGPICTYQPCPSNTRSECYGDRDGDGCEECACVPTDCPTEEPPECNAPGEFLTCEERDGCSTCWCDVIACPPIDTQEDLSCDADQRVECLPNDVCGTDCWCEDSMCPPYEFIDCESGMVSRAIDSDGCTFLTCSLKVCPQLACNEIVCPYGYDTDDNECPTCECNVPEPCPDEPDCDLFCEYGQAQGVDGCLMCACNPPPLCEPIECDDVICPGGYVLDDSGCQTCECAPSVCQDDEQCGLYEACVFDFSDPEPCCPPDISCDALLPFCVGECEPQTPCTQGQLCGMGQACGEQERDDCCQLGALCSDNIPSCPLVCIDQTP